MNKPKQLFWIAEGIGERVEKFVAVEGEEINVDNIHSDLFYYERKGDRYFIVELTTGISISSGSNLKYALEHLDEILEKQGMVSINEKINSYKKDIQRVPNERPTIAGEIINA